jgi:DNA polymerase-3 subunit epsilon
LQPVLATTDDLFFGHDPQLHGLFTSTRKAKDALRAIADAYGLCPALLGLEKHRAGKPCFSSQVQKCRGACAGKETVESHNERVAAALESLRLQTWPYEGAIGIRENGAVHVIDCWAYLGSTGTVAEARLLPQQGRQRFDRDVYQIMQKWLPKVSARIVQLGCATDEDPPAGIEITALPGSILKESANDATPDTD